jgi:hypothetical protein
MAKWKVSVDFVDDDGDESWDEVIVEAETEADAVKVGEAEVERRNDVDTIEHVEAVWQEQ